MLGLMEEGADYNDVLKQAQDLGYAETDPTADVEGHDVRSKMVILTQLAFGVTIPKIEEIPCLGISQIDAVDFEYAKLLKCTIKLVGTAVRLSNYGTFTTHSVHKIFSCSIPLAMHDGPLSVYVTPKMVPTDHMLAMAKTNGNAVVIRSANLGTTSFLGPGAGRYETANSIVADVCRIQRNRKNIAFPEHDSDSVPSSLDWNYVSPFYIRIPFQDELGIIKRVGALAEQHSVNLYSILQTPILDKMEADVAVITDSCSYEQIRKLVQDLEKQDFCRMKPVYMPIMKEL